MTTAHASATWVDRLERHLADEPNRGAFHDQEGHRPDRICSKRAREDALAQAASGSSGAFGLSELSIGPEHGTVGQTQVREAAKEAMKGIGHDTLIVCGFAFDPHVNEEVKEYG